MKACAYGCDMYRTGGSAFCDCACISVNDEGGYEACLTGCTFALQISSTTNNAPATATTPVPPTTTTETSGMPNTTITGCTDDNGAVGVYFSVVLGRSLTCVQMQHMGGCELPDMALVTKQMCPVSCGICQGGTAPTNIPGSSHGASPIPVVAYLVPSVVGSVIVVCVVVAVIRRRRRLVSITTEISIGTSPHSAHTSYRHGDNLQEQGIFVRFTPVLDLESKS